MLWPLKLVLAVACVSVAYVALFGAPYNYPTGTSIRVAKGTSISQAAATLHDAGALRSPFIFKVAVRLLDADGVQAGAYALQNPQSGLLLAYRFARGDFGLDTARVTVPEGSTITDIANNMAEALPGFDRSAFLVAAKGKEGYLFPDTYYIVPGIVESDIVARMLQNYELKVAPLRARIASSTRTEAEIIIMASILQEEVRKPDTMRIVSGILWKRISIGMALQVDAVFGYIFNRPTYNPSLDDLTVDSPYNTYKNRGLPPGPISNPGLDAIEAALNPTPSKYLYYLTGKDGVMRYATTFEQHIDNRRFLK